MNWPGFVLHGKTVDVSKPYEWIWRGQSMGMLRDVRYRDIEVSLAVDKLRVLE